MNRLYEMKGYVLQYYAKYSDYADKVIRFIVAFLGFMFVNQYVGFSGLIANPFITIVLSAICMLLPSSMTVVFVMITMLLQLFTISEGAALVVAAFFLIIYGFYARYAPGKMIVMLLVPIAFMLHIPVTVPIILGLVGSPIYILPISMGAAVYYLLDYIKLNSTLIETVGEGGVLAQAGNYVEQILVNREMWCSILALAICLLVVYKVRRMAVDHAWEIAIVAGVLVNIIVSAFGYIIMDIRLSYLSLIIGSVVGILAAFFVKLFVFAVDYTRTEKVQYEDDEYYYYVKAVPKVSVTVPEKTLKHINERQKTEEEE